MDSLAALEKYFAALRDRFVWALFEKGAVLLTRSRLYDERIVALNDELAQLSATKPSHPEFLRQLDCIRKFRDEKFDTEKKLLVYKTKSLKTKSVAQRSQIHSAYFQTVRDVREKHLDRIGERLSRVRRDHVKADEKVPNYSIPFPTRRSTQITQQTSYNKEVSVLSGIAKYVGFPAAPNVSSAFQAEMDEDMERMGVSLTYTLFVSSGRLRGARSR
jgi:Sds3-like